MSIIKALARTALKAAVFTYDQVNLKVLYPMNSAAIKAVEKFTGEKLVSTVYNLSLSEIAKLGWTPSQLTNYQFSWMFCAVLLREEVRDYLPSSILNNEAFMRHVTEGAQKYMTYLQGMVKHREEILNVANSN